MIIFELRVKQKIDCQVGCSKTFYMILSLTFTVTVFWLISASRAYSVPSACLNTT